MGLARRVSSEGVGQVVTLGEFERLHPDIARDLRQMTGDYSDLPFTKMTKYRSRMPHEVTGVYEAYEDGSVVWYAMVEAVNGTDMAVYKDGKWTYSDEYFFQT